MVVRDLGAALRTRSRVLTIATDPDMDSDVKLFAFCLQAYLIGRDRPAGWESRSWTEVVGEMMERPNSLSLKAYGPAGVCSRAIAKDLPRYEAPIPDEPLVCRSPKARGPQAGEPCGKPSTGARVLDRHSLTGAGTWIGYCRNHSHPALDEWRRERLNAWDANGRPSPPANTGGVLMRYFGGNWDSLYRWASSWSTTARVGDEPDQDQAVPRPCFTLIDGGGQEPGSPSIDHVKLTVVASPDSNG